ncbi:MAG: NTPase [Candidatus Hermodarchaeota archaeon]
MNQKILITGPPRCGKSTLVSKLIKYYTFEKNYIIYGFLTPEVREGGNRIGFDIVDIFSGDISQLARVGSFNSKHHVGKYSVFVENLNEFIKQKLDLEVKTPDLIIIDEIGKMELFSTKFQDVIKMVFISDLPVIATIGLRLNHPLKNYLINLPSLKLITLNRQNSQNIFEKVISIIS